MKRICALILALLLCGTLTPVVLAAKEPTASADSVMYTDSGSVTDSDISPVIAAPPTAITLTRFDEPNRTDAVAFAVGTSQGELSAWFADVVAGFIGYDADGNSYDLVSGAWSLDAMNTGTAGVYYASAVPDLGTEYALADGVSLPRQLCAVSIQTPGKPDINCCASARGFVRFPWVLSAEQQEQLDEFAVWLRQNGGEWTSLSDGFCFTSGDLQLSQRILKYGSTYELKVTYPGGQTGVLSFKYDGELSIIDYSCGDRDGGDAGGGDSGTGTQPAPTTPQTPDNSQKDDGHDNSSSESNEPQEEQSSSSGETQPKPSAPVYSYTSFFHKPKDTSTALDSANTQPEKVLEEPADVSESYSPTQTVISGLRLHNLCKDEESVVFGSGNLTVSIPSRLLLALNLSDSDILTVKLTQPENNQIMLAVEASGKVITELSGTVLRLRYRPQSMDAQITVQNEAGEQITDTAYDGELLRFAADAAGVYTIIELSNTQEARKGVSPLFPVSGGLILAVGGIEFFRRRCHG